MKPPRISASGYSNTAPLIWSFLYGANHGRVELILDNAPARSAQLLAEGRVDAALVPVIAFQLIGDARLLPDVCVGARERVQSVCIITDGRGLDSVRSVSLDLCSRTSAVLTKIIFREFFGSEPTWLEAEPDIAAMLEKADAALLIGDPALSLSTAEGGEYRVFDLAELWRRHTGLGFVFAMWMTRGSTPAIDFAAARDEGLAHIEEIAANYEVEIGLSHPQMVEYLSKSISYSVDAEMEAGMKLYFDLAFRHGLVERNRGLGF